MLRTLISSFVMIYLIGINLIANADSSVSEADIRRIIAPMLQEKDQQIKKLEARIKQLEQNASSGSSVETTSSITPPSFDNSAAKVTLATEASSANSSSEQAPIKPKPIAAIEKTTLLSKQVIELKEKVEGLKDSARENGLDISGFFDINAKTENSTDQTFSVGSIELDLEYDHRDNVAASAALVLCGNSSGINPVSFPSAPVAVSCGSSGPGGIGAGPAGFAVAFIDYHRFDHSIPPRGRIFNNQGFHIQAGRFDLPFSSDYQNYANKDRVSITAPITTSRMQFGGFNGDGIRTYGSWKRLNYSIFWTDAMYAASGSSVGGRLGMTFGDNAFRLHGNNQEGIEIGLSHLSDLDYSNNLRNLVFGVDFSFNYQILRLQSEFMWLRPQDRFIVEDGVSPARNFGYANEFGYHTTLIANLEDWLKHPLSTFLRYGRWQPKHRFSTDFDHSLVAVSDVSLLTVGFNYQFSEYMKLKFEYTDSLGTSTQEHYFDKKLGIAQMVVVF